MKGLVRVLAFGSALFVLAGTAVVQADQNVDCGASKCSIPVSIAPGAEVNYDPVCTLQGYRVENMVCHKATDITCTKAIEDPDWTCTCSNWDLFGKTHSTTIDIWCSAESK